MTYFTGAAGVLCLAIFSMPAIAHGAQAVPAAASTTPAIEHVDPAALMAMPDDYAGRTVSFTVMASGGLSRGADGTMSVYVDDYFHLSPTLQGDALKKWIKAGFAQDRVYPVTFIGHVIPNPDSPFVNFEVEDFTVGGSP